jgi:alkanesulfonate monooxygenase SsuD/methylene tetrahydromethanopterin reductase-like flavin-dependent oxidoreductase (luciferase family)
VITKFSVLYVGHIELEDIGRDGTPADERRYPNERLIEAYQTAKDLAQLMDELGFYCLWTAEHHFQREGYEVFPNLILLNTWLATQTKRLKLGCAFNVLPAWHPLRLAEDYAVADIVTGGRIIFGIGRGYQSREVETLGGPLLDQDANRELFEEQLEVLRKAFDEESFSHHGKHYRIPAPVEFRDYALEEVTLVPRPIHRPVEIWQAISSGRSIPRMAQQGIKGMVTLTGVRMLDEWVHLFRAEAAKAGRTLELGEDICWGVGVCLAETEEEAIRRMEPFHDERYKWFAPFGIVRYIDDQGRQWGTPGAPSGVPSLRDGVAQRAWLCGPPSAVIERIREIEERYPGLDQMMIHFPEGMPSAEFGDQLRLFARDVMPAFEPTRVAAGARP